ncbi:hypothetical protein CJ030_MR4G029052 [Morella rubra]|uniref:RNase H type-1 domain-containing protein n=1 Tax=Morella rubra TaxID=262757 RepID=A0A6A1VWK2_9ROSI|nr:hypothetical protein CJ030_MR4G029052 [Morella rubra]
MKNIRRRGFSIPRTVQSCWTPPVDPYWKINFDVAVCPSFTMLAVVCRNFAADTLFVWTKSMPPGPPILGEANAALFAAQEAHLLSKEEVMFEGDSLSVVQAICQEGISSDWSISSIISDICHIWESHPSWSFHHVNRKANIVAHTVAQWAAKEMLIGNIPTHCIPVHCLSSDNPRIPP